MFSFAVFDLVFQYQAKRLAGKNVSKRTYCIYIPVKDNIVVENWAKN